MYFAEGQRTIVEHRECEAPHRWQGTIANDGYTGRIWRDGTIEGVIHAMDRDLGPIPEDAYQVVE